MEWKISDKLTQPEVSHYISWLGRVGYRSMDCAMTYDVRSYQLMRELFEMLRKLMPVSKNGARSLWLRAKRGEIADFAKHYGDYEELLADGSVKNHAEYETYWRDMFPNEIEWYELTAVEDPEIDYQAVFLHHRHVLEQDGRKEKYEFTYDISPFMEWLVESVRLCIEALEAGAYNDFVEQELPAKHRVGIISRKDFWSIYPEDREEYFRSLKPFEIDAFLENAISDKALVERLPQMSANDFFRCCALGYQANGYEGANLSPRDQYFKHADGRHGGLDDIDPDSPEAFATRCGGQGHWGSHPWEVCRGGNSTHVSLYVVQDEDGYYLQVAGTSTWRSVEAIKFFLALHDAGMPVVIQDAELLKARLNGTEKIGVVPHGVTPAYCHSWFPNDKVEIFTNLSDEEPEKMAALCIWQPLTPAELL